MPSIKQTWPSQRTQGQAGWSKRIFATLEIRSKIVSN